MLSMLILTLFNSLVLSFFFNRGFAYYDEGFILHAAQRVLNGEIPYRDFDLIYTPGSIFLTAGFLKIFGESILVGRILSLLIALLTGSLVYLISFRISKNKVISIFPVLIYLAWGPSHINFPWPTHFALTAGLIALLFYPNLPLAGLLSFMVFLFKQNFGVAVILAFIIDISLSSQKKIKKIVKLLLGFFVGLIIFLIYLQITGSTSSFFNNFYYYSIKALLINGAVSTSFPTGLKGIFYLLPLIVSSLAVFLNGKNKGLLIYPVFTALFYLFGIRPTTDYPHLTMLVSMIGLPMMVILPNKQLRYYFFILGFLFIGFGFYTALFKNYYRWDSPLIKQIYYIQNPRTEIFVDRKFAKIIPQLTLEVKRYTAKNDYIFIFPNAPIFYFLTERKNPTKYINMPNLLYKKEQEKQVIINLKSKKVKLILLNEDLETQNYKLIKDYLYKNYKKSTVIAEFSIWLRKNW